jgi:glycosyltransferase involved in cell wall biosynthesis
LSQLATDAQRTIVLCGPSVQLGSKGYGGGKGGFVRNVAALLEHFADGDVRMTLSPYSVRTFSPWWKVALPFRLIADLVAFARNMRRGAAVHLMMTYGLAIYREFSIGMITVASGRPLILDIRGGSFVSWLKSAGPLQSAMARWLLKHAATILGQGIAVVAYLTPKYGAKVHHFPNFVQTRYLPPTVRTKIVRPELAVVFVGYCYGGKGVFELVNGCARAAQMGLSIRLTMVGAESPDFRDFLDGYVLPIGLSVKRCGTLDFDEVQELLADHDIFCFPTRHSGEGHPNAITEAMAHGLVIVTTRHGFIPELLSETDAYFVAPSSADELAAALLYIDSNRDEARQKAGAARAALQARYTEARVLGQLRDLYHRALQQAQRP